MTEKITKKLPHKAVQGFPALSQLGCADPIVFMPSDPNNLQFVELAIVCHGPGYLITFYHIRKETKYYKSNFDGNLTVNVCHTVLD